MKNIEEEYKNSVLYIMNDRDNYIHSVSHYNLVYQKRCMGYSGRDVMLNYDIFSPCEEHII